MNKYSYGNLFSFLNAVLLILLSLVGLLIGFIFSFSDFSPNGLSTGDLVKIIYLLYLMFGILLIINSGLCFIKKNKSFYGELHLMVNLVFLTLILVLPIPIIIETSDSILIIVYSTLLILFVNSCIIGILGGILNLLSKNE